MRNDDLFSIGESNTSSARDELAAWFESVPGKSLLRAERSALDHQLFSLFGYFAVQVGAIGGADLMRNSRVMHRCLVDDKVANIAGDCQAIRGAPAELPIDSDSVDVLLMPHVLEFDSQPREALREAVRVLVPEGHLIIVAFNPWSVYGLWRTLSHGRARAPWSGQFFAQPRVRDWLELLGMQITAVQGLGFAPPIHNARLQARMRRLNKPMKHLPASLANACMLVARKRVSKMTSIPARQRFRPRLVDVAIAQPASRVKQRTTDSE